MKNTYAAFYIIGGILIVVGLMSGTLAGSAAGCESPIYGTCLLLAGNAATLVKIGSVTAIAGWVCELFYLLQNR